MKNRNTLGQLLAIILFVGVFAGTAHSSVLSNVAVSYVENALIPIEAKNAILAVISNDKNADEWITINDNIMYSLCVLRVPESKSKKPAVIKTIERDTMKTALIKAETNIALYLDKGRLDRNIYIDKEAADFALRTSYSARLKGLQTSANIIEHTAVGLVSASLNDVHINETLSEKTITENYCSYLYKKAQNFFSKGDYGNALETFREIHFLAWANINAYLGASLCFLKMNKPDDAGNLASELFAVLSADMTPDEKTSAAKLLFHSGKKNEAFSVLLNAYSSLKAK